MPNKLSAKVTISTSMKRGKNWTYVPSIKAFKTSHLDDSFKCDCGKTIPNKLGMHRCSCERTWNMQQLDSGKTASKNELICRPVPEHRDRILATRQLNADMAGIIGDEAGGHFSPNDPDSFNAKGGTGLEQVVRKNQSAGDTAPVLHDDSVLKEVASYVRKEAIWPFQQDPGVKQLNDVTNQLNNTTDRLDATTRNTYQGIENELSGYRRNMGTEHPYDVSHGVTRDNQGVITSPIPPDHAAAMLNYKTAVFVRNTSVQKEAWPWGKSQPAPQGPQGLTPQDAMWYRQQQQAGGVQFQPHPGWGSTTKASGGSYDGIKWDHLPGNLTQSGASIGVQRDTVQPDGNTTWMMYAAHPNKDPNAPIDTSTGNPKPLVHTYTNLPSMQIGKAIGQDYANGVIAAPTEDKTFDYQKMQQQLPGALPQLPSLKAFVRKAAGGWGTQQTPGYPATITPNTPAVKTPKNPYGQGLQPGQSPTTTNKPINNNPPITNQQTRQPKIIEGPELDQAFSPASERQTKNMTQQYDESQYKLGWALADIDEPLPKGRLTYSFVNGYRDSLFEKVAANAPGYDTIAPAFAPGDKDKTNTMSDYTETQEKNLSQETKDVRDDLANKKDRQNAAGQADDSTMLDMEGWKTSALVRELERRGIAVGRH